MLLRVLTAAVTLPTSPLLSAWLCSEQELATGLGEGVLGAGAGAGAGLLTDTPLDPPEAGVCWLVLEGPELELRMTRPPLPWSWVRERTRGVWPRLGVE